MALSAKAKSELRVALGDKIHADEISAAVDNASAGVVPAGSVSEVELSTAVATKINTALVDATTALGKTQVAASENLAGVAPTSAVCVTKFGSIASQNGLCHVILDSSDATKTWIVCSDGVKWWAVAATATV